VRVHEVHDRSRGHPSDLIKPLISREALPRKQETRTSLRDGGRVEVGLAAELGDALRRPHRVLQLRGRVLGELCRDLRAIDPGGRDGVPGVARPAHDFGGDHVVEHGDQLLRVEAERRGTRPVLHLPPGLRADPFHVEHEVVARRIVIESYQEIVRWIGDAGPTTRRLLEKILEEGEEHADDIVDLLGL